MKFNPIVSIALSPDADWRLHSFDIPESSLTKWKDKPWSGRRVSKPRSHRNADDRVFPLRHLPLDGHDDDAQQPPPAGPFLHEAPQSIQDLFQTLMEEELIEGEELREPIHFRSWYVHHRRVPEWNVPRSQELVGHWRFWAAEILAGWDDQIYRDEDVALAVVFPNPPRNNVDVMHPVVFDLLVIQGLDLPRRACLATVLRFQDPQQRAERSLAISLPHLVSAKYIAARAHLVHECQLRECTVRHGRVYLPWNDVPAHDVRDGQSFIIRRLPDDSIASASTRPVAPADASTAVAQPEARDDEVHLTHDDDDLDYDSNVSMASTPDRQSVFVYRLAAPTSFGHADWSSHNAMIASIARIAEVPLDQVVTAHALQCTLPDQPLQVQAVILQHVQDIQPASLECLVVIDLELHAHRRPGAPPIVPHCTRQVHRVYPLLRRVNILELTRVAAYCEWVRNSCLVYHNGRGWPILELAPRHIQHGAYFKVIVPPPPEGHGDTAHAVQVAQEAAELFDFPLAGHIIPGILAADDPNGAPANPPDGNIHVRTCKNGEDQEFDDFPVSEATHRPHPPLRPDVDWSIDWTSQISRLFQAHGMAEVIDGPAYLYLQTWYIHHDRHVWCRNPRPVRLTNEVISWSLDLREPWVDQLDPDVPVVIRLVQPSPVQAPLQSYSGHVVLEQAQPPGRSAIVVSALFESLQGNALMQFAKSVPRHLTAQDVIQECELVPHCSVRPCSVWIGPRQLNIAVALAIESGTGVRVHLRPMPYDTHAAASQPPYNDDVLHARPSLPSIADEHDDTFYVEDERIDDSITMLQRRVACVQRNLQMMLAVKSSGLDLRPCVVEHPVDGPAKRRRLELDALIPPAPQATVIRAPCHKVAFFANQLMTLDLGLVHPFASVVKWHEQTLLARVAYPDWQYELPIRIWFYTDGASSARIDPPHRRASASVVLLLETVRGMRFGGFRVCKVPAPATAPFAEHAALHLATLWCIQVQEWCRSAFGTTGIETTFAFDCHAAGYAAQGRWFCPQHATLHQRTRALQHWIQSRYACVSAFLHVHSHRGDPWNEAADAACWAALHDWIPCLDFDALCQHQLAPFDDVVTWLWYWQCALHGEVGFPTVADGFLNFSFVHDETPVLDSSAHTFCQMQCDDSNAMCHTASFTLRVATANVLTLYSNQAAQGRYVSARHEALMRAFHLQGVHLVGVQETRSKLTGHHDSEHYHILAAPALANGHGGLQLWVAKCIVIDNVHLQIRTSHLRVLHQSARRLLVRLSVDGLRLLLIVGHVPCVPDIHAAQKWWHQVLQDLPATYRNWPRVMLVDANARVGSLVSTAIGPHQASEESEHGALMHQWMIDHGMFAPQTIDCHHSGPASTFAHAKGHEGRIDYVLVDEALRHPDLCTFVTDIDLATQRPDHYAVAADIPMTLWYRSRQSTSMASRSRGLDLKHSPLPTIPWSMDVHSHAALLHQWLQSRQPKRPHLPRKKHLQSATWQLIQLKAFHWKRSRQIRATLRMTTLRAIFDAWKTPESSSDCCSPPRAWLKNGHMDLAWHLVLHRRLSTEVANAVRRDDASFFESFAPLLNGTLMKLCRRFGRH